MHWWAGVSIEAILAQRTLKDDPGEIRASFLKYFEGHATGRAQLPLLPEMTRRCFTNAGMNQFKDVFGREQRDTGARLVAEVHAVSGAQRSDNVGPRAAYTFFEMLGNFVRRLSHDAIELAWTLVTKQWD